jgi:hypothetical protein
MMTSVERLMAALNHRPPDRVPMDFGGTHVTGISVWSVIALRKALLGEGKPLVKVVEPYQMLGEIDDTLCDALGIDVVGITSDETMFGFPNREWKPFTLHDGTEVLVPGRFHTTTTEKGDLFIHPEGDMSVPPSGRMPKGGFYFDALHRQERIDEDRLNPEDNLEEFNLLPAEQLRHFADRAECAAGSGRAAVLSVPGTGFGDIALVPATWMKHPKGIRGVEDWYMSTIARRNYVEAVFEGQLEIALQNLDALFPLLGRRVQAAFVTGTDFGTQRGPFISPQDYRDLFKPYHRRVNDHIHAHTDWKTFIHSCGSVVDLIGDFIEAGFDILNPVQCSAAGMEAGKLKREFGRDIVFWGGGVDTQKTLVFGTPAAVYDEVRSRIAAFGEGGGYVFNAIHNIQACTPVENMLAMFKAVRESSG